MKQMGLKSKLARRFRVTTDSNHKGPVAKNILNQDFFSFSPLKKCVSDITYIPTKNGFLYLTIVMDLFNRDIIGWSLSSNMITKDTVLAVINKATTQWSFNSGMIFHSDRGTQYASKATRNTLKFGTENKEDIRTYDYQTIEEFNNQYRKQNINNVA